MEANHHVRNNPGPSCLLGEEMVWPRANNYVLVTHDCPMFSPPFKVLLNRIGLLVERGSINDGGLFGFLYDR